MSLIINPYAFQTAGGGFAPSDISGLLVWLKADAITGLSDGDPVTTWEDSGSNNNDATEATNKPVYKTNILNSLPVVRFTAASTHRLAIADNAGLNPTNITVFAVVKAATGQVGFIVNKNFSGGTVPYSFSANQGIEYYSAGWHTSGRTTDIRGSGNFHVIAGRYDGAALEFYIAGALDKTVADAGSLPSNSSPLYVGTYPNDGVFLNGDLAELVIYDSALDSFDMADVNTYLETKYGL